MRDKAGGLDARHPLSRRFSVFVWRKPLDPVVEVSKATNIYSRGYVLGEVGAASVWPQML